MATAIRKASPRRVPNFSRPRRIIFLRLSHCARHNFPRGYAGYLLDRMASFRDYGHRGYTQRSSFLLKARNQLSNLAGSLASALRRGRHPPLIVILNV